MKLSSSFFITRRENPKDENIIASSLLVRSGMILKNESGLYSYLPMGLRVLENIKKVIREEMKDINAHETLVPVIGEYTPSSFGVEEFNFLDRNDKRLKLFSSSESLFAYLIGIENSDLED